MTSTNKRKIQVRYAAAVVFLAIVAALSLAGSRPANARTYFSLHVGVPLYAGPSPYYYGYGPYYAPYGYGPPPIYYAPPPVVVVPAPVAASCRSGLWRQQNGSIVNGVACLQPNGVWQLTNY